MKKYIVGLVFAAIATAGVAYADSYYWHISWNDGSDTPSISDVFAQDRFEIVAHPAGGSRAPDLWGLDGSFSFNSNNKTIGIGNISQDNVDLLVPTLAGKVSTSTYNTQVSSFNSQISSLQSQVNSMASSTATSTFQGTRVQTDSSGTYTWTFPTAFASGTTPIVTVVAEDNTSGAMTNAQITSISNTQVTVQARRLSTILGILTLTTNPQVYVDITAKKP